MSWSGARRSPWAHRGSGPRRLRADRRRWPGHARRGRGGPFAAWPIRRASPGGRACSWARAAEPLGDRAGGGGGRHRPPRRQRGRRPRRRAGQPPALGRGAGVPPDAAEGRGLFPGDDPGSDLVAAWREYGQPWSGGPGVAWVGGRGATAAAEALEAWAAGRAVVTLPGTPSHDLLRQGGALRTETILEVIEATTYLMSTPALARVLGTRGRQVAQSPTIPTGGRPADAGGGRVGPAVLDGGPVTTMRLAMVLPHYGGEVGGGAEQLGRWHAQRLARRHDVTVLTTCATDCSTWADDHPPGDARVGEVRIHRFRVPQPRVPERFERWDRAATAGRLSVTGLVRWMHEQGPNSPELLDHLDREGAGYDAVLFVSYLHATTWDGLPLVADRSLLIPALQNRPPAAFPIMDRTFRLARGLAFSTPEERDFCRERFGPLTARSRLVGIGVDPPPPSTHPTPGTEPYVLYLGRVNPRTDATTSCANTGVRSWSVLASPGWCSPAMSRCPCLRGAGSRREAASRSGRGTICSQGPQSWFSLRLTWGCRWPCWRHGPTGGRCS